MAAGIFLCTILAKIAGKCNFENLKSRQKIPRMMDSAVFFVN